MKQQFEMVAKTLQGLEDVLAQELRDLGAENVMPGRRMVSFEGDLAMMYKANVCCRTALSILKPIYKFIAKDAESLYEMVKEYDWSTVLSLDKTFSIDTVSHSNEFTHSRFVTYRVKDGIVDFFKDKFGPDKRPGVRLHDADVMINVHIDSDRITLSLNSSGESLHKRGYRVAQTEAPINEVLAAGIILKSGWRGDCPLVDPMCGSGTFLIEAALIAAGIKPGSFRKDFAFEHWHDFDGELLDSIINDHSDRREPAFKIYGADISPKAVAIAERNIMSAGVDEWVSLRIKPLNKWEEAPAGGVPGVLVTNPPYGERINVDDMEALYSLIGTKLKHVFTGYHAWIISSNEEYLTRIGLTPSVKEPMQNGGLDCELREFVIFEGEKKEFKRAGGTLKSNAPRRGERNERRRLSDDEWKNDARRRGMGGKEARPARRGDRDERRGDRENSRGREERRPSRLEDKYRPTRGAYARRDDSRRDRDDNRPEERPLSEAEQLLSRRRNPDALKGLGSPKRPSIPRPEGPFMRTRRRGWKRGDSEENV
ncbi:MAG: RNA methyltransferase [Duncaniella sp.]|nr:RNA methyltransferase [Duncaniella sp.]MDE6325475.1 RNA methyltransferase [Duncaniella sp.]